MVKKNACIFISGSGSNLKNLIDTGVFVGNNKWRAVYKPLESLFPDYLCSIFHKYPNLIKNH